MVLKPKSHCGRVTKIQGQRINTWDNYVVNTCFVGFFIGED